MKKTLQYSLLLFVLSAKPAIADSFLWNGAAGTGGTNMSIGTNWSGTSPAPPPTIAGPNDFTFPSNALNFAVSNDLGNVVITSLTFTSPTSYALTSVSGNQFVISSGATISASSGAHSIGVPISLSGLLTINSTTSALSFASIQQNLDVGFSPGDVTITSGSVLFSGVNNYLGVTTINGGATLQANIATALPQSTVNNGTLNFAIASGTSSYNAEIAGTPTSAADLGILVTGPGTLQLGALSYNQFYTGPFSITNGILSIVSAENLGDSSATNILSLGPGTLQVTASLVFPIARTINLTDAGTIDVVNKTVTFQGIISEATSGTGALTVTGGTTGVLTLEGVNTYSGGTTVQGGTLSISQVSNIGSGPVTLGGSTPTLRITSPIPNFSLPITVSSASTIDLQNNPVTLSKPLSGSGRLTVKAGSSILTLASSSGASSMSGGTTIATGTVQGDTTSISGPYTLSAGTTLTFDQSTSGTLIPSGTYSGVLTSAVNGVGTLSKEGTGTVIISGASGSTFSGATTISGGVLTVTGSLQGSTVSVQAGATLSGSGTVGPVTSTGGTLGPNGLNRLTVSGALSLDANSTYSVEIAPIGVSDSILANSASLEGAKIFVDPDDGFYGFGTTYTILQGLAPVSGNFATPTTSNSNYILSTSKSPDDTTVFLHLQVIQPFLGFPADNANIQSVVNYFNTLGNSGLLASNATMVNVINALAGQSFAVVNDALDQLHPAAFSAFGELQADVGGHLISLFHRRPGTTSCQSSWRVWVEPYGNWLDEKNTGMQQGFFARSYGGAMGIDGEIFQNFVFGLGGAYNHSDLTWKHNRGDAHVHGYYGAAYIDYTYDFLYFGAAVLAGIDQYHTNRHIQFTTIDETATGSHDAFDLIAQFSTGMFFGPSACCLAPYLNVDYFLLNQHGFTETGAPGLNLSINDFSNHTIRTELGVGMQVKDSNYDQTICLSPRVAIGWTMETPVYREQITSSLQNETLTFKVKGWDYTWQLLSFKFGLDLSYKCFTIGGEYIGEINGNDKFWSQQANANLSWHW